MRIELKHKINLKNCPICGSDPLLVTQDLGEPNGRGYPGDYSFWFYCPFCRKVEGKGSSTVYTESKEEAVELAIKSWNEEVDKIENFLNKKD